MNFKISKYTCGAIIVILFMTVINIGNWKNHSIIKSDVNIYYAYLPAAFIFHDLKFNFVDKLPKDFPGTIWYVKTDEGKRVQKTTMGLAILYLPFFILAHLLALMFGFTANGYSQIYQFFIALSALFYTAIGLIYLRKILLLFFNEAVTIITILSIYFGTNLFYYITTEGAMSHSYNFFLFTLIMYYSILWLDNQKLRYAIILGLTAGILTLIRPTNILIMLFPILFKVSNLSEIRGRFIMFAEKWKQLALFILLMIIMFIPQIIYWKYSTGHWAYFSYKSEAEGNLVEKFYFLHPHIFKGLFGFRKGWFIYTPIMLFSIAGLIYSIIRKKYFAIAAAVFTVLNIYIALSWWSWWYGGGFGLRAFIDSYALLALPMAAFYQYLFSGRMIIKITAALIITGLIGLNLFQTLQYRYCLIHWDSMTKQAYFRVFGKLKFPPDQDKYLKAPDYVSAIKGEKEK